MIEEAIILLQIIFIDIILAADNAIIIGLIAANFVPKYRKQIILWGVAGALVFKVIFAIFEANATGVVKLTVNEPEELVIVDPKNPLPPWKVPPLFQMLATVFVEANIGSAVEVVES